MYSYHHGVGSLVAVVLALICAQLRLSVRYEINVLRALYALPIKGFHTCDKCRNREIPTFSIGSDVLSISTAHSINVQGAPFEGTKSSESFIGTEGTLSGIEFATAGGRSAKAKYSGQSYCISEKQSRLYIPSETGRSSTSCHPLLSGASTQTL